VIPVPLTPLEKWKHFPQSWKILNIQCYRMKDHGNTYLLGTSGIATCYFFRVNIAQSLVFRIIFCWQLFVLSFIVLSFLFTKYGFFLSTPLVSSYFSYLSWLCEIRTYRTIYTDGLPDRWGNKLTCIFNYYSSLGHNKP